MKPRRRLVYDCNKYGGFNYFNIYLDDLNYEMFRQIDTNNIAHMFLNADATPSKLIKLGFIISLIGYNLT